MLPLQRASSAASLAVSERAHKRWDLLRMHFLEYPLHSKRLSCQKWHTLVESALEQSRELRHRRQVDYPLKLCASFGPLLMAGGWCTGFQVNLHLYACLGARALSGG